MKLKCFRGQYTGSIKRDADPIVIPKGVVGPVQSEVAASWLCSPKSFLLPWNRDESESAFGVAISEAKVTDVKWLRARVEQLRANGASRREAREVAEAEVGMLASVRVARVHLFAGNQLNIETTSAHLVRMRARLMKYGMDVSLTRPPTAVDAVRWALAEGHTVQRVKTATTTTEDKEVMRFLLDREGEGGIQSACVSVQDPDRGTVTLTLRGSDSWDVEIDAVLDDTDFDVFAAYVEPIRAAIVTWKP